MDTTADISGSFSEKLFRVLDNMEYRRVETSEDMEDIARLRYKAYKAREILPVKASSMIDEVDFDSHAYVFGVYYYEQLISTIRVHYVTPEHRVCQSDGIFPDAVHGFLDAGMTLIDPARLAADPDIYGDIPSIPYLTLRPTIVAAIYFNADRVLQHVRPAHSAFYRRVFYADTVVPATYTSTYGFDLILLATRAKEVKASLLKRFPIFDSEPFERRMLFERNPETNMPLTVLPTARLVASHHGGSGQRFS